MPIVWPPTYMRRDHRNSMMQYLKSKKLNAVQQLTAMISPPSTVNMISNNEDHCFQCQEQGHIARNCPNIRCFECDEYGHIVMDCPHKILPLGTTAKHHLPKCTKTTIPGQAPDIAMKTGTGEVVPGHSHISTETAAQVTMIHIEVIPGHNIGIIATTPGVAHDAQVSHTGVIAINLAMTHHIHPTTHHLHTEDHHHTTPETEDNHFHIHPTNLQDKVDIGHTHTPIDHKANHITRRTPE